MQEAGHCATYARSSRQSGQVGRRPCRTQHLPLQEDFDRASAEAKELPSGTSNDDQLILYGLFKQANIGDCNTSESPMRQSAA